MKRFVICFDGTWQKLAQPLPTNIAIISRSIAHTAHGPNGEAIPQIVIYTQGVGSNTDALGKTGFMDGISEGLNRILGGVFGDGLEDNIVDTYLRLAFNYEAGDEIYIFGFSRGAFSARSLAGLIGATGIVSRLHVERAWDAFRLYRTRPTAKATQFEKDDYEKSRREFRLKYGKGRRSQTGERIATDEVPEITYLGIFDTVGQRGMPSALGGLASNWNKIYGFHDLKIGENIHAARHAVAIDERRLGFPSTPWEDLDNANTRANAKYGTAPHQKHYQQRWFVGTHGDIGGGEGSPLSAAPLKWIAEGAAACGLRFYATHGADESPLDEAIRKAGLCYDGRISRPKFWDSLSPMNYQIYTRRIWTSKKRKELPTTDFAADALHTTVAQRAAHKQLKYRPPNLRPFRTIITSLLPQDETPPAPPAEPSPPPEQKAG
jgi:uncharacterized protein (DUF2235 family)